MKADDLSRATAPVADLTPTILDALRQTPGLHSQVLALALGVDIEVIRAVLLRLEHEGRARREGATRGTRWFAAAEAPAASPQAAAPAATTRPVPLERKRRAPKTARLDRLREQIGTVPDSAIAEQAGVSTELVRQYRRRHRIPGIQEHGTPRPPRAAKGVRPAIRQAVPAAEASAAARAAAPAPRAETSAWKVSFSDGQVKYAIGKDVAEAAAGTLECGGGNVVAIEWVGQTLA